MRACSMICRSQYEDECKHTVIYEGACVHRSQYQEACMHPRRLQYACMRPSCPPVYACMDAFLRLSAMLPCISLSPHLSAMRSCISLSLAHSLARCTLQWNTLQCTCRQRMLTYADVCCKSQSSTLRCTCRQVFRQNSKSGHVRCGSFFVLSIVSFYCSFFFLWVIWACDL